MLTLGVIGYGYWGPNIVRNFNSIETARVMMVADYFTRCILDDETPINDGHAGLRIVRMLEACDQSLRNEGGLVYL